MSCPWLNGASNWYSTSYDPLTRLYYVQTNDNCGIYTRTDMEYQEGRSYMGGSFSGDPAHRGQRILRAFDICTGEPVWQLPQIGDVASWEGSSARLVAWSSLDLMTGRSRPLTRRMESCFGAFKRMHPLMPRP